MKRVILMAALLATVAAPAAAQDYETDADGENTWDGGPLVLLLTGRADLVGLHDEDFCRFMASITPPDDDAPPSDDAIAFCVESIGGWSGPALLPETMLRIISPPAAASAGAPLTAFDDGYYVVGEDIRAGTYRARVEADCYWARYRDFNDGLIDNGLADHSRVYEVTIKKTDAAFESSGCGTWTRKK